MHVRPVVLDSLTTLTVKQWDRMLEDEVVATSSCLERAVLSRRAFGLDALNRPRCALPMRIVATATEPAA